MREINRRGQKPVSRGARRLEPEEQAAATSVDAQPQPPPAASAEVVAEPGVQTIKVPSLQELQEAHVAQAGHAVDTDGMVQDAQSTRSRRSDRRKEQKAARKPSALIKVLRMTAVLLVLVAAGLLAPRDWLIGLVPDKLLGVLHTATPTAEATSSPSPLPTSTPTPQPTADLGSSVVILDGVSTGLPAFGDTIEGQLKGFGENNHIKTEYVRCDATGLGDAYARLTASGTTPVLVFGPYEALRSMAQDMSDKKDAGIQLGLNAKLLALGGDDRVIPLSVRLNGVFVRQSRWKGALPTSYDELLTGLQALGGNAPDSFPLGLPLGCAAGEAFCRDMLAAYGADLANPAACNPQDVALALTWFQTAFDNRLTPTDSLNWDEAQARNAIATVSAATGGDGALLQGLDSVTTADLRLLAPLQGPKGRFCTADIMGMAMPKAAKPDAVRLFYQSRLVEQKGLDSALQGDTDGVLPAPDKLLTALDPAKNPWSRWLGQMDGITVRNKTAVTGPMASQAVAAVAVGSYTPEEAAQWLLAK